MRQGSGVSVLVAGMPVLMGLIREERAEETRPAGNPIKDYSIRRR